MTDRFYAAPPAGLPPQSARTVDRAVFKTAYAVIPSGAMRDIVTSRLPHWRDTRAWVLARPLSGFAETFAQYIVEVGPGGGSDTPEPEHGAEAVLFVLDGRPSLTLDDTRHALRPGSYVFIGPGSCWALHNQDDAPALFQWIRKRYAHVAGIDAPASFVTHDDDVAPQPMPNCNGVWATTRFVDADDIAHDMHVTIVTFQPGGVIPFSETHVMEHGLYVLEGKAVYQLNEDWVEVEAGDFMWLRAFCPQACYAAGPGPFRYLLYKDVNRHPSLALNQPGGSRDE
ncbi:bifunctional allantoicase/(S)-ureidoglycine aminohydrolase [Salinisphaera sp.]|uniref:bifunctional allantoicase/(S)-ureidoglycine aminohydrolase n=1 Tax=Salinisphaera sp. TaxID=1914330 RepID=UPI002D779765|nr:bifunctional allantoicase/(S)-ureidoglycine aminohydrolase [Salinisphaera sp.]HET7315641.1 bifunctional allantoicase/(S)-ureidoglycine aminohydrolase [Salinisphaera sp.]